jgi:mannose-6-phosphate isomerase
VIVEVQQNSDTTYRVFDWNRHGLDGKPRELHVDESMASIDFEDFEPVLTPASQSLVADCPYFHVEKQALSSPVNIGKVDDFSIITCLTGSVECGEVTLKPGFFMIIPATPTEAMLTPGEAGTSILVTRLP